MRQKIITTINSSRAVSYGLLVLLIFIVAMKQQPLPDMQAADKSYTYLALGDSYTIGEKVAANENFPSQVVTLLKEKGI